MRSSGSALRVGRAAGSHARHTRRRLRSRACVAPSLRCCSRSSWSRPAAPTRGRPLRRRSPRRPARPRAPARRPLPPRWRSRGWSRPAASSATTTRTARWSTTACRRSGASTTRAGWPATSTTSRCRTRWRCTRSSTARCGSPTTRTCPRRRWSGWPLSRSATASTSWCPRRRGWTHAGRRCCLGRGAAGAERGRPAARGLRSSSTPAAGRAASPARRAGRNGLTLREARGLVGGGTSA